MDPVTAPKPLLTRMASAFERGALAVIIFPLAIAFMIAASLAAGPSEVFKAMTGRK